MYGDDERPPQPSPAGTIAVSLGEGDEAEDEFAGIEEELSRLGGGAGGAGAAEDELDLERQLKDIYDMAQEGGEEEEPVDPADYIMNDWPETPRRRALLAALLEAAEVTPVGRTEASDVAEVEVLGIQTDSRRVQVSRGPPAGRARPPRPAPAPRPRRLL